MGRPPRLASAYFALQGVLVLAWWTWLLMVPKVRSWFFVLDFEQGRQTYFLADVLVLGLGSLLVSAAIWRQSRHSALAAAFVTGAVAYATISSLSASTPFGIASMSLAIAGCGYFAWGEHRP